MTKEGNTDLMHDFTTVYVLVITHDRPEFLRSRTIPSIQKQTYPISGLVLVDDSEIDENRVQNEKLLKIANIKNSVYLLNNRTPGAAGAWNTGINWIYEHEKTAWVAILDDDDEWKENHIQLCISHSARYQAVISGIAVIKDKELIAENCPKELSLQNFLEGNPGWQGSNTFIRAKFIKKIGGFDEELLCTHDRNLAIKCFEDPSFNYSVTGECTVFYNLELNRASLTIPKGYGKKTGILQFYKMHYKKMDEENKDKFKKRAKVLFNVDLDLLNLVENNFENQGFKNSPMTSKNKWKRLISVLNVKIKTYWSLFRTNKWITKVLGPQFNPSLDQIEIDITYDCNLNCKNCNRSCRQAPEKLEINLDKIEEFVSDSIKYNIKWKRIRILGGEPTLHSQFEKILYSLINYKLYNPETRLELVTNGFGKQVQRNLLKVPPFYHIENSHKLSPNQLNFLAFNLAPRDDKRFKNVDYRNGCSNLTECGIGLTPLGYYPCALAGGIDRITNYKLGIRRLPIRREQLVELLPKFCSLCGRFQSRIFIPYNLRLQIKEELRSTSWEQIYKKWRKERGEDVHVPES